MHQIYHAKNTYETFLTNLFVLAATSIILYFQYYLPGSSNGRTLGFGPRYWGSSPYPGTLKTGSKRDHLLFMNSNPNTVDIFQEIRNLNFPLGSYVVVGSGSLEAHGIREARDLDIVVTPELYDRCELEGWDKQWHNTGQRYVLHKHAHNIEVEVYLDVNCGNVQPTTPELIERADIIDDIPFVSLEDLLAFKKCYGRPQDKPDVQKIEAQLAKQSLQI